MIFKIKTTMRYIIFVISLIFVTSCNSGFSEQLNSIAIAVEVEKDKSYYLIFLLLMIVHLLLKIHQK